MSPRSIVALAAAAVLSLPTAATAALTSQGVVRMGVETLWARGIAGQGQTVAILDEGFAGLDRSIALGELPPREEIAIRVGDPLAGLGGATILGLPTEHGVRIAEIVHDIAPEALLMLVSYRTPEQFAEAAAWVAAAGIPVVVHANSFLSGPFDGSGPAASVVDAAAAAGVVWVNSAGNYAQRHWRGSVSAAALPIAAAPGTPLIFALSWSDPRIRAELVVERRDPGGDWVEVQRGAPDGERGARTAPLSAGAGEWRVVVRRTEGPAGELTLFSQTVGFGDRAVADGSVPTPGDARGAISVGAVRWPGTRVEPYSSRGPTDDGRAAPDLVAPTYVTSNPEWPSTAGTSAAAAHVGGIVALLRQNRLAVGLAAGPAEIRAALGRAALDLGAPGPDPVYGAGLARIDDDRPRLVIRILRGRRPVVRVRAVDRGRIRRLSIRVDGRRVREVRRAAAGVRLRGLRQGLHRVRVSAEDWSGNRRARALRLRVPRR